mmetsp:Transcript_52683/g.112411  ORF Transcript_52683/g.112411 Transcript_52683/m.112411 type:complete len:286 (+) Transcript_52683:148-1005(+)|eukprot:CAMPEP_0206444622 /NCGR_PEP_ID=MMETSP0324_2-20121206/15017_1 /ASSEMBLY_ACC=CAM_ASM_000836 /TAXON_ID=2866 /ORGANISM="Crypthecodinium cohnii, Strain Seligo" /LENGTH=285 /DNA_ID=CAMNT_0053912671 /DNA_START=89 /DNA_END=946 /DNA_ORIENTATION=-
MENLSDSQIALIRLGGVAIGAILVTCVLGRNSAGRVKLLFGAKSLEEEREIFLARLKQANIRFYATCQSVERVANVAREKLKVSTVQVTEEQIQRLLREQCQVGVHLRRIITETLECNEEEFHDIQTRQQDPDVVEHLKGFDAMLQAALQGNTPILPQARIPPSMNPSIALITMAEIYDREHEKVLEKLQGQQVQQAHLMEVLAACHREACLEYVSVRFPELANRPDTYEAFYSALALYSLEDEIFGNKRKAIYKMHQDQQAASFSFSQGEEDEKPEVNLPAESA